MKATALQFVQWTKGSVLIMCGEDETPEPSTKQWPMSHLLNIANTHYIETWASFDLPFSLVDRISRIESGSENWVGVEAESVDVDGVHAVPGSMSHRRRWEGVDVPDGRGGNLDSRILNLTDTFVGRVWGGPCLLTDARIKGVHIDSGYWRAVYVATPRSYAPQVLSTPTSKRLLLL